MNGSTELIKLIRSIGPEPEGEFKYLLLPLLENYLVLLERPGSEAEQSEKMRELTQQGHALSAWMNQQLTPEPRMFGSIEQGCKLLKAALDLGRLICVRGLTQVRWDNSDELEQTLESLNRRIRGALARKTGALEASHQHMQVNLGVIQLGLERFGLACAHEAQNALEGRLLSKGLGQDMFVVIQNLKWTVENFKDQIEVFLRATAQMFSADLVDKRACSELLTEMKLELLKGLGELQEGVPAYVPHLGELAQEFTGAAIGAPISELSDLLIQEADAVDAIFRGLHVEEDLPEEAELEIGPHF